MNSIHQQCIAQGTRNRIAPLGRALNQTCASLMTAVMQQSRAALAAGLILSMVMSTSADGIAQEAPPPPSPTAAAPMQAADLDQLVAPIALYPDALVAQILAASTYGPQVVEADAFLRLHPGMPPQELASIVDTKPWDPSVKALTAFPSVL